MNFLVLLVTTLVTCAIQSQAYTSTDRRISSIEKRQATNADQMVQNILQWLQGVYAQNSRRIRQGTLREYLPPSNTEKPRPFQPGYPDAGYTPELPFPFPTNPATGGVTAPEGYQPGGDNEVLVPPENGSGGGENGHIPEVQPTIPSEGPTQPPQQPTGYPTAQPGLPTGLPTSPNEGKSESLPTHEAVPEGTPSPEGTPAAEGTTAPEGTPAPEKPPGTPEEPAATPEEPVGTPEEPAGTPEEPPGTPGMPFTSQPSAPPTIHEQPQPTSPPYTSAPDSGTPQPTEGQHPSGVPPSETAPSGSTLFPEQPTEPHAVPVPEGTPVPEVPGEPAAGSTLPSISTLVPSGFTTSTASAPSVPEQPAEGTPAPDASEGAETTIGPEANTIPGTGKVEPTVVDEDEQKHPPHIHAIDVQCSKEMMTINIEFNREFNGVIYSKGHYNEPECRYVQENSGQTKYTFTVNLNMCGTEFVNAFDTENQSYLENILVLQNELGIQEVWDTIRSVRCLWEGNIKDTLSVAFSIGMLSQEIVTFSGDTAMAKLDVVMGRGPFGEPANGLVKIGEQMTLVVSVSGDPGFDLQVKECKAVDSLSKNSVALTDEEGCILKPKLFGAFQKTKETGSTGASIIAYAYFNAFKFPDEMDLMIECNIELCKTDCEICSKEGQQLEPSRRRRRDVSYNNTVSGDWITMGKLVRVILPEDLNYRTAMELTTRDHICLTTKSFVFSTALIVSLLVVTSFTCVCLWMKRREKMYLKY